MEEGISEQETIFLEVDGAGSRAVHLGVYPTPRGWIEHPISLVLGKRMGVGWDGSYKAEAGKICKGGKTSLGPCPELASEVYSLRQGKVSLHEGKAEAHTCLVCGHM